MSFVCESINLAKNGIMNFLWKTIKTLPGLVFYGSNRVWPYFVHTLLDAYK